MIVFQVIGGISALYCRRAESEERRQLIRVNVGDEPANEIRSSTLTLTAIWFLGNALAKLLLICATAIIIHLLLNFGDSPDPGKNLEIFSKASFIVGMFIVGMFIEGFAGFFHTFRKG